MKHQWGSLCSSLETTLGRFRCLSVFSLPHASAGTHYWRPFHGPFRSVEWTEGMAEGPHPVYRLRPFDCWYHSFHWNPSPLDHRIGHSCLLKPVLSRKPHPILIRIRLAGKGCPSCRSRGPSRGLSGDNSCTLFAYSNTRLGLVEDSNQRESGQEREYDRKSAQFSRPKGVCPPCTKGRARQILAFSRAHWFSSKPVYLFSNTAHPSPCLSQEGIQALFSFHNQGGPEMNITCPTCNESYQIKDHRSIFHAQLTCKRCQGIISIDAAGTARGGFQGDAGPTGSEARTPSPGGEHDSLADRAIFADYPDLRNIPPNKVSLGEILSPDKQGHYKSRKNKYKAKILMAVLPVLDKVLRDGEKVVRIGKGTAYYPVELLLGNGWLTSVYNNYAILATNERLLFINVDSRMKHTTHYLFQIPFENIKKVKRGMMLGGLIFYTLSSRKRVFNSVKRFLAKELSEFIMNHEALGKGTEKNVPEDICPSCFTPLSKGLSVCPSCEAPFKTPKRASLRSLFLPGLGDIYLGHRALGVMESLGSFMIWAYAVALFLSGNRRELWIGIFLLIAYNSFDAIITYFMAKKGYMLA